MEKITVYPGSFGEIIQGKFREKDILCSCPINLYTKVRVYETLEEKNINMHYKSYKFMLNILKEWGYDKYFHNLSIDIKSQVPRGKGFASSTADLAAVYNCLINIFQKQYNQKELIDNCIKIEPTDSIIFDELTLFDYRKGNYRESIGKCPQFNILVFEGDKVVNTVEFNNKPLPPLSNIEDLVPTLKEGIKNKDINKIAYCSTESIVRNTNRLEYSILPIVLKIQKEIGAYGIIGAHSGDALGIIYEGDIKDDIFNKYFNILKGIKTYKVKSLDKWI
ncbi:GHMP family kinase ATP-binding protein [Clostridium tetani]|uniref:GHMP family kinase ATP-binding protein n=1 Tax=Clostridium tetani TaxID=1513 RepID=UPI001FB09FA1|nr:kinase [Clostridium tetani]BDR63669.1 kinase [Clostridium tetani]